MVRWMFRTALVVVGVVASFSVARAAATPIITSASADPKLTSLTIVGANFGSGTPQVVLGTTALTVDASQSGASSVVASLSGQSPGSYVLKLTPAGTNATATFWVTIGAVGPQGPAGTFSGSFKSPNGQYTISVTDDGIVLSGPNSSIKVKQDGTHIDGWQYATPTSYKYDNGYAYNYGTTYNEGTTYNDGVIWNFGTTTNTASSTTNDNGSYWHLGRDYFIGQCVAGSGGYNGPLQVTDGTYSWTTQGMFLWRSTCQP